jgi:hypothetical protein
MNSEVAAKRVGIEIEVLARRASSSSTETPA